MEHVSHTTHTIPCEYPAPYAVFFSYLLLLVLTCLYTTLEEVNTRSLLGAAHTSLKSIIILCYNPTLMFEAVALLTPQTISVPRLNLNYSSYPGDFVRSLYG